MSWLLPWQMNGVPWYGGDSVPDRTGYADLQQTNLSDPHRIDSQLRPGQYDPLCCSGHQILVMDESWVEGAPILDGRLENSVQMEFSFENGQIRCQMGYVPSEAPMSNPAVVDCIVSFQDGQFVLTEPTFSPNTLTAPGCLLLWTTNNGQVMQPPPRKSMNPAVRPMETRMASSFTASKALPPYLLSSIS